MLKLVCAIFVCLYLVALHTSMAGMEILSGILILFALYAVATKKISFKTDLQFPILIFTGIMLLELLFTPQLKSWSDRVGDLRWIFVYWGVAKSIELCWSNIFENKLFKVWLGTICFVALYALLQFFTGVDLVRNTSAHITNWENVFRATGFFSVSLTFAYALGVSGFALTIPLAKWRKNMSAVALFATSIIIVTSMARGAWLAYALSLVLGLILIRSRLNRRQLVAIILACLIPSALLLGTRGGQDRVYKSVTMAKDDSNSIRKDLWAAYFYIFKQHPIVGVGSSQGPLFLKDAYKDLGINQDFVSHAHNDYLRVLAENGLLGFLGFVTLLIWVIARIWQLRHVDWNWSTSLLLAQTYILLGSLTQVNFTDAEVSHGIVFTWALASALHTLHAQGRLKDGA